MVGFSQFPGRMWENGKKKGHNISLFSPCFGRILTKAGTLKDQFLQAALHS
jgi:hypothetical protein